MSASDFVDLRAHIREVDDFPTPGVGFKDITPLLADAAALKQTISELAQELMALLLWREIRDVANQ